MYTELSPSQRLISKSIQNCGYIIFHMHTVHTCTCICVHTTLIVMVLNCITFSENVHYSKLFSLIIILVLCNRHVLCCVHMRVRMCVYAS